MAGLTIFLLQELGEQEFVTLPAAHVLEVGTRTPLTRDTESPLNSPPPHHPPIPFHHPLRQVLSYLADQHFFHSHVLDRLEDAVEDVAAVRKEQWEHKMKRAKEEKKRAKEKKEREKQEKKDKDAAASAADLEADEKLARELAMFVVVWGT